MISSVVLIAVAGVFVNGWFRCVNNISYSFFPVFNAIFASPVDFWSTFVFAFYSDVLLCFPSKDMVGSPNLGTDMYISR